VRNPTLYYLDKPDEAKLQNNNNSEGVDRNEQCSSNVKEAPNPNVWQSPKLENGTAHISDTSSFCRMAKF